GDGAIRPMPHGQLSRSTSISGRETGFLKVRGRLAGRSGTPDGQTRSPAPDGLGSWAEDDRDIVFLLEYDTGSEHLPKLAGKLHGYADMAEHSLAFKVP